MLGTKAPGTQIKPFYAAVYCNCGWMNIGCPAAVSVALGMTDIMTELR